jgi:predicted anti-sigma-YlaC factor YlaD
MHEPIKSDLEEYLNGRKKEIPSAFDAHLRSCEACASELRQLEMQAAMLRSLRHAEEMEPPAGFYARVMDRIEEQARASIWTVFLQPRFGRRLAIASAALVLLLGTYLVTTEQSGPPAAPASVAVVTTNASPEDVLISQDTPEQQQQRDAVLVDLASFRE